LLLVRIPVAGVGTGRTFGMMADPP
jgi:hypothetical protein